MKLKTEVRQGDDMVVPIATGDEFDQFNAYCHDAAYAHAMLQAINEIGVTKDGMYAECCVARDTQSFLWERAAEIMAEWGFADGCG